MRALVSEYDLVVPKSVPEALSLMSANGRWRPIAGGTDLMVLFNSGKLPYRRLISIRDLGELRTIEVTEQNVLIGAATTYTAIRNHSVLNSEFPLLCQAASWTGAVANQNRGTLGGNLANASPAADSSPMLLAYGADLELSSLAGKRWLPYSEFHLGYKQIDLRPDELITRIRLPRASSELVQYARKVGTRKAQAISKVCLAAVAERSNGALAKVRIAIGSVAPVPLRCYETEHVLQRSRLTPAVITEAKQTILREISPIDDIRSTQQYRAQVSMNLLGEFLDSVA
jgi:CO/xanthine dehydrogenase FAD-binding subunit